MAESVTQNQPETKEVFCPEDGYHVIYSFVDDNNETRWMYQPCKDDVRDVRMFTDFLSCFTEMPLLHQEYFDLPWEKLVATLDRHVEVISEYIADYEKHSMTGKMDVVKTMHDTVLEESDLRFFHRVKQVKIVLRNSDGLHPIKIEDL